MSNDTTFTETIRAEIHLSLDEPVQQGAQRMPAQALQAEVEEYIRRHAGERDENNHWWCETAAAGNERSIAVPAS